VTELSEFNFADVWEAVVDRVADREALIFRDRRLTYGEIEARANQLAHFMAARGVRAGDHVGLYLMNCPEYVEAMLAAYKLRAVPINVNYRYVADELRYLLDDADVVGVLYNDDLADRVDGVRADLPTVRFWLDIETEYEDAISPFSSDRDFEPRSGDDAYVLYTGGTTGMPKGVVWRQEDAFFSCIGGGDPMRMVGPVAEPAEVLDRIIDDTFVYFPVAPLMHAAGQWTSLSWWYAGGKVVLLPGSLDPAYVWSTIEAERVNLVTVVGDPVVRPLVDEWDRSGPYDVSSLFSIGSGGAPLSPVLRNRLAELLPEITISDGFGSSETGAQGSYRTAGSSGADSSGDGHARFAPMDDTTVVLDEATLQPVIAGTGTVGRVARSGHIPSGYYNDPDKTAQTFVEVNGRRYVITGDMATVEDDGTIRLLGRGSGCINTGGEKVFPEEVEAVLKSHPSVYDAVVVGVTDERWGQRVAAVVQLASDHEPTLDELADHCRKSLAGYKVPRTLVLVDEVVRSPAGKADYRWAKAAAGDPV
jgi:acyl-CoA synthetase (AMP-forming)/AMP-acid ligase II